MKAVTILAMIGLVIQLIWTIASQMIYTFGSEVVEVDYKVMGVVWLIVNTFSTLTLIAFFATFLSRIDKRQAE